MVTEEYIKAGSFINTTESPESPSLSGRRGSDPLRKTHFENEIGIASKTMSIDVFNRFVRLAARAFYDDITPEGDNKQPRTGRISDNRGIAVVVLDALSRRQWVREEDLAKDLKLHPKQLRWVLQFLMEERLVIREHRKETAKGVKIFSAAVAATANGQQHRKEGDEKTKLQTHSYCCLDYAQIYDVVRYRLHLLKKELKNELERKHTVEEYVCHNCRKRYNALDALQLVSMEDEYFHCEICNGILVAENGKLDSQNTTGRDCKAMLQNMEVQLKPLMEQINRIKDLPFPEFGSLQAWEARASAPRLAENGDSRAINPSISSHGLGDGMPMPFVGDTKVEVVFSKVEDKGEDHIKSEADNTDQKVVPPWMIKQGMNLTMEQRGEVSQMHDSSHQVRQVGMKSERDEDEGDDDIDWE
uniref:general transcription factor IIE subunit 1-like n=1 Tax=Fragaria vesca subsp. vesca TaxID=101020 RepID=UPI0005CB2A24|nr:PREDICTED: general transcription factor IIE subunit 1-like [Fragaria vesca subsp. vesca]